MKKFYVWSMVALVCLSSVAVWAQKPGKRGPSRKQQVQELQRQVGALQASNAVLRAQNNLLEREVAYLWTANQESRQAQNAAVLDKRLESAAMAAASQAVKNPSQQTDQLAGTEIFLPTRQLQECCAKYIGGKSSGGTKCLDWAKATYAQHPSLFQVLSCNYQEEITGHMKGKQTISVTYQIGASKAQKVFSEIFFFKE